MVYEFAAKSSFVRKVGNNNFFDPKIQAIRSIYKRLNKSIYAPREAIIFKECNATDETKATVTVPVP